MDPLQEQFERAHGDKLIDWLNERNGTAYAFSRRAGEAPDLVYSDGQQELFMEVTAAYYDGPHAEFLWEGARDVEADIEPWTGVNPSTSLANEIRNRIQRKSQNSYGKKCILLVVVPPGLTSAEELEDFIKEETTTFAELPFVGVYVAGRFPITETSEGGYRVIVIKQFC